MSPLYKYWCCNCNKFWEDFQAVANRDNEVCSECGYHATRQPTIPARPVVMEYYSENLDAQITGPEQKRRIMRERNVSEVE